MMRAFGTQAGYYHVSMRSSGSSAGFNQPNNAGRANEFVRVVVEFNHPAFTWILGGANAFIPLSTEALVINERFARPTGVVGVLPPEPVADQHARRDDVHTGHGRGGGQRYQ